MTRLRHPAAPRTGRRRPSGPLPGRRLAHPARRGASVRRISSTERSLTLAFTSDLVTTTSVRRVAIELPEERAEALALALIDGSVWSDWDASADLRDLYNALMGAK